MSSNEKIESALRSLDSLKESAREKAVKVLVRTKDPRVIPALERVGRGDPSLEIRFLAKDGLQTLRLNLTQETNLDEIAGTVPQEPGLRPINLDRLKKFLLDPDVDVRNKAVRSAIAYGNPAALRVLAPHVKRERSVKVKCNIILALGILGDRSHIALLVHYVEHKQPAFRTHAVMGLSYISDVSVYPRLVHCLTDKSQNVRNASFRALVRLGKPKVIKLLLKMSKSSHLWMRLAAARACGKFANHEVLKILAQNLSDPDAKVRKLARASLRKLNRKGMEQAASILDEYKDAGGEMSTEIELPKRLDSPINDPDPRCRIAEIQRMIDDKDTGLLDMATVRLGIEEDERVKASLLIGLGRIGGPTVIATIKPYLATKERRIRASAVEALSHIDSPEIVEILEPMLSDDDNRTRANAIVALVEADDIDVYAALEELVVAEDRNSKLSAIYAILELQNPRATGLLRKLDKDPDELILKKLERARKILADEGLLRKASGSVESARLEIPQELESPAPSTESKKHAIDGNDRSASTLHCDRVDTENLAQSVELLPEDVEEQLPDRPRSYSDSRPSRGTQEAPVDENGDESETAPSTQSQARKKLPGFRTQIDDMFAKAAVDKIATPQKKKPTKKQKPAKGPGTEGVSRGQFFDKLASLFKGGDDDSDEEKSINVKNIILICAAAVGLGLIVFFLMGDDSDYGDDYYDNDDF